MKQPTASRSLRKSRIWSAVVIFFSNILALVLLNRWFPGLQIGSIGGAVVLIVIYAVVTVVYYWLFQAVLIRFPYWIFPLLSAFLAGGLLYGAVKLVPGIVLSDLNSSIVVIVVLVGVNTLLSAYFALNTNEEFYLRLSKRIIGKKSVVKETDEPGMLLIEIDGLSEKMLHEALKRGSLPTVQRLLDTGNYKVEGWETDYSSQTGAIQAGLLLGSNDEIPAYRWWERGRGKMMRSGSFRDAYEIERLHSNGEGLLNGGASRGNMFSGDASESIFTVSTILDFGRRTGPGFYIYLLNPFTFARLLFRFLFGVLREWAQNIAQRIRRDKFRVKSRNFLYAFTRAATTELLQDLLTFIVIGDVLRGVPAIYTTFPGYDDVAHFTGLSSREAFQTLEEMDRFFKRIVRALDETPRPYQIFFLSDHGQTSGGSFESAWGLKLDKLVRRAIARPVDIFTSSEVSEAWERWEAVLAEEDPNQRKNRRIPLKVLLRMERKKDPDKLHRADDFGLSDEALVDEKRPQLAVFPSGCSGLVYFTDAKERLSLEEIQTRTPNLVYNLVEHPGVGFVVMRSEVDGNIVLGKRGAYYLDAEAVEGENPLADFSPNSPGLLKRVCHYQNAPDLLISTAYDLESGTMSGFEDQSGHHGGIGGDQSFPFLLYPAELTLESEVVGAEALYSQLMKWRRAIQGGG